MSKLSTLTGVCGLNLMNQYDSESISGPHKCHTCSSYYVDFHPANKVNSTDSHPVNLRLYCIGGRDNGNSASGCICSRGMDTSIYACYYGKHDPHACLNNLVSSTHKLKNDICERH